MKVITTSLSGKSIAVVGNSTPTTDLGHEIDSHDLVVRMNGGSLPENLKKGNSGVKTDLVVFNRIRLNGIGISDKSQAQINETQAMYDYLECSKVPVLFTFRKNEPFDIGYVNGFPPEIWKGNVHADIDTIGLVPREVYNFIHSRYGYGFPTSGLLSIIYILLYSKPKELVLYNFNFNGTHFFDKSYKDPFTDKNNTLTGGEMVVHKADLEVKIIEDLMTIFKNLHYA